MKDKPEIAYVGLDASKDTLAVSVADDGRYGIGVQFLLPLFLLIGC